MRITEETRFPHPVLSQATGDFLSGEFSIEFTGREIPSTGALTLEYEVLLTEPAIRELVLQGKACVGCFVRCSDTYFTELLKLSWPQGRSEFAPGRLLNRVTLQPLIWLDSRLDSWDPGTVHPEFEPPVSLARGDILAIGPEHVMSVGQAKFAPLESIFELQNVAGLEEGRVAVSPDGDRIAITVGPSTFEAVAVLRGQAGGQHVLMNGIYLPAVMEVLDLLRSGAEQYEGRRWYQPFMAKCDMKAIRFARDMSIFESAQSLLDWPARGLSTLVSEGES